MTTTRLKDYDSWATNPSLAVERDNECAEKRANIINLNAQNLFDTPLNCLFLYLDKHPQDWDVAETLFKKCLMTEEFRIFLKMATLSEATYERLREEKQQREDCELPASHYHRFLRRQHC